jgi:hypothetical protein
MFESSKCGFYTTDTSNTSEINFSKPISSCRCVFVENTTLAFDAHVMELALKSKRTSVGDEGVAHFSC